MGRPTIPVAPVINTLVSCSIIVLSFRISVGQYSAAGGLPPAEFEQIVHHKRAEARQEALAA
jgi:hypothetical protein